MILRNTHQKHKSILILIVKISVYVIFLSFFDIVNLVAIHNCWQSPQLKPQKRCVNSAVNRTW